MPKKRNKTSSRFLSFFKDSIPFFVFLGLLLNIVVVFFFEQSRKPQVIYSVERVPVTNFVERVIESVDSSSEDVSSRSSPSNSVSSNSVSVSVYYDYFTVSGVRVVKMWERYWNEGSLTSYGRVSKIFPDRIFLDDGTIISNLKSYSPSPNYSYSPPPNYNAGDDRFRVSNFKRDIVND